MWNCLVILLIHIFIGCILFHQVGIILRTFLLYWRRMCMLLTLVLKYVLNWRRNKHLLLLPFFCVFPFKGCVFWIKISTFAKWPKDVCGYKLTVWPAMFSNFIRHLSLSGYCPWDEALLFTVTEPARSERDWSCTPDSAVGNTDATLIMYFRWMDRTSLSVACFRGSTNGPPTKEQHGCVDLGVQGEAIPGIRSIAPPCCPIPQGMLPLHLMQHKGDHRHSAHWEGIPVLKRG